jgi:hypothetical protein
MANIVIIEGQFNKDGSYFADSPVIIRVSGLEWPSTNPSPFTVVQVNVMYGDKVVGNFHADTGGQTEITFDISTALQAIWSGYTYDAEVSAGNGRGSTTRGFRSYSMEMYTEYIADDGVFTTSPKVAFPGGKCMIGGLTPLERSWVGYADASAQEFANLRYGDASTKPTSTPERVGSLSPTSWVDLSASGTTSHYYAAGATMGNDGNSDHAPLVLRDSVPYVDFLFLNRRGAVETCSGQTLESMGINVKVTQYSRTEHPSFAPTRSLMAIGQDGRRSWQMSSGYVTREWAEWWALEFLSGKRNQWWMRYPIGDANGTYVPVIVEPAKQNISIYDRAKQQMPHVDFTVTLALEG